MHACARRPEGAAEANVWAKKTLARTKRHTQLLFVVMNIFACCARAHTRIIKIKTIKKRKRKGKLQTVQLEKLEPGSMGFNVFY